MTRGTRKRLSGWERRSQLIEIGRSVFAERGYDGTSVEEVADRAKISKPVVYDHFGGKQGLYAVIVDREMDHVTEEITRAISKGTPRERLEKAVMAFLVYAKERPDGFAVLSRDSPMGIGMTNLLAEVAVRVGDVFASEFKKLGYDEKSSPIYAQGLIGMVTFAAQWWRENPGTPIEQVASHVVALSWSGLRNLPKEPDRPHQQPASTT